MGFKPPFSFLCKYKFFNQTHGNGFFAFFLLVICSRFLFDERGHCAFHFHQVLFSKNQISAKTSPILKEVCNVFLTWFVILKSEGPRLTWFSFSGWTEPMYIKCHAFGDQYNQDPGNLNWYLVKSSPS